MANSIFQKLAVATAGAALSFAVIEAKPAHAAIISYDFTADVTSGPLSGQEGFGSFSYDTSPQPPTGPIQNFPLTDFNFSFLNKTYSLGDIRLFDRLTQISFLTFGPDGLLSSNSFVIGGSSATGPDIVIRNNDFITSIGSPTSPSFGSVTYSLRQPSTSVPEPSTVFGLSVLGLGWFFRKKIGSAQRA